MSDAPLTDAATIPWNYPGTETDDKLPASFGREVERKLIVANENKKYGWETARECHATYEKEHKKLLSTKSVLQNAYNAMKKVWEDHHWLTSDSTVELLAAIKGAEKELGVEE